MRGIINKLMSAIIEVSFDLVFVIMKHHSIRITSLQGYLFKNCNSFMTIFIQSRRKIERFSTSGVRIVLLV